MLRPIKARQRLVRMILAHLDTSGSGTLTAGSTEMTLVRNGTGDVTLTFKTPHLRAPIVGIGIETAVCSAQLSSVTKTAIRVKLFAMDGTTPKDGVVHLTSTGFDAPDQV